MIFDVEQAFNGGIDGFGRLSACQHVHLSASWSGQGKSQSERLQIGVRIYGNC
jgi:hypothetical protein